MVYWSLVLHKKHINTAIFFAYAYNTGVEFYSRDRMTATVEIALPNLNATDLARGKGKS